MCEAVTLSLCHNGGLPSYITFIIIIITIIIIIIIIIIGLVVSMSDY